MLLDLVRSEPSWNRKRLIEELGWSRSTLGKRIDELLEAGLIVIGGQQDSTGGRPAETISLHASAGIILALDIGASHSRLAVADLGGTILAEDEADVLIGSGPNEVFEWALQCFDLLLKQLGQSRDAVRALGIGVPDAVDPATGILTNPVMMPNWRGTVLTEMLRDAFPEAVVAVERDVSIMALAEHRFGWPDVDNLALVKVSSGLGCGLILGGGIYRGAHGNAGALGQLVRRGVDGRIGHLDEIASGWALQRELIVRGQRVRTTADIVSLVRRGDLETEASLRQLAGTVAESLVDVVSLINPQVLVVGGTLAAAGEPVLGPIRDLIRAQAPMLAGAVPEVVEARLGGRSGLIGAGQIALDALFAPDRISAMTSAKAEATETSVLS